MTDEESVMGLYTLPEGQKATPKSEEGCLSGGESQVVEASVAVVSSGAGPSPAQPASMSRGIKSRIIVFFMSFQRDYRGHAAARRAVSPV